MQLFSDVPQSMTQINNCLYTKINGEYINDLFEHEQNLLIRENDKYVLFAGCAHKGIVNIVNKPEQLCGQEVDYVVGGFHLFNPVSRKTEKNQVIESIACQLRKKKTKFFTCHCTGQKAFKILRQYMGEQIQYLSTGCVIEI